MADEELPPLERAKLELDGKGIETIKGAKTDDLTTMQALFCLYYVQGYSGAAAARKAGYSENSAREIASENLTKPIIKAEIERVRREVLNRLEISATEVILNQLINATSDIMDHVEMDIHGRPSIILSKSREKTRAIKSLEVTELPPMTIVENGQELQREVLKTKITLHDKNSSADFIAKVMKLYGTNGGEGAAASLEDQYKNMPVMEVCKRIAFLFAMADRNKKPVVEAQVVENPPQ